MAFRAENVRRLKHSAEIGGFDGQHLDYVIKFVNMTKRAKLEAVDGYRGGPTNRLVLPIAVMEERFVEAFINGMGTVAKAVDGFIARTVDKTFKDITKEK